MIHSWWIPKLGGKVDGVPGYMNETWFKIPADKAGTVFRGQCAELCGAGHADMRARGASGDAGPVRGWAERTREEIQEAGELLSEQRKRRAGEPGEESDGSR